MLNQRWLFRVDSYRPPAERIDPTRYDVAPIPDDATARAFVVAHHYSASYPAARRRFGLYRSGELAGVAVFSVPCHPAVLAPFAPHGDAAELGRFVLLDEVPGNGESWFLARCLDALRREGFAGVVSFSDPVPRTTAAGARVFPGHVGTVYQATSARYLGRATARTLRLLPDGRVYSDRALAKVRAGSQGWRYAAAILEAHGAAPCPDGDQGDRAAWLASWLPRLTRPMRHPGNHRYAWALRRPARAALAAGQAYPKRLAAG